MGNESNNVPQLEFLETEQDEKKLRAVGKDGLVGVKTKSRAGSVDERTLNDPNHLLQEEREAKGKMPVYKGLENYKLVEKMGE